MKILLTTDTIGGVWTYAVELARALQSHDVQVLLATMGAPVNDSQRFQAEALQNVQLIESSFKLEWMPDPWDDVRQAGDWLLQLEEDHRPDVIHLNGFAHGALPWSAPVLMVGHSCVCSWWKAVKGEPAPTEWDVYRDAVKAGLQRADLVVAPSHAMLAALVDHYGPLPRARVIYNGRDVGPFRAEEKEAFVLSAGRLWDEAKNASALQQAAPRLPWPVYVAGDQSHPGGHSATASAVNLHTLGRLTEPQLAGWMSRAAIYALPARYEPFGLSALEAALSGCALVLGDIDTLREIWGEAALYVPPDDVQQLSRTLNALVADPSLCATMGSRAQARASRYTLGRMGQQYRDVYTMLLDQQFNGRIRHEGERRAVPARTRTSTPTLPEIECAS